MKTEIKEISPTQREIHLQIGADALKESYARVSQKYAKRATVPGFRKGFAPLDVVRLRFKEEIRSEVLQDVIPGHVTEAIQEHDLHPLAEPHLHLEDQENVKVNGSQPISLHMHFEVMPEIPVPNIDGIEVVRRVKPVDDSQVEAIITERLQKEAALMPVEGRASEVGDVVVADLVGRFADDPDAEPITAEALEVPLDDQVIEQSFTENLVGVRPDETKEFTVEYPETFSSSALAGKTVHYTAHIKSVGKREIPEANDEWAKSLDEGYESISDLRSRLKADLEKYNAADADARVKNDLIAKIVQENAFEVPNTLIENQARNLLNNFARDLQQRGVDMNKVENEFIQMAYHNMRQQAETDVRGAMLLDKIAEMEKVEIADADVDNEIRKIAEYYQATPEQIRESLEKQGGLDNIRSNLRNQRSVEAVAAKAKITEGPWIDESAPAEITSGETAGEKPEKAPKKKTAAKKSTKDAE